MANYANKYSEEYVPEDNFKEAILCQNPIPDDLDNVKKLGDFSRDILKEKCKTNKIMKMFWKSFSEKLLMRWVLCRNYGIFWREEQGQKKMLSKYL